MKTSQTTLEMYSAYVLQCVAALQWQPHKFCSASVGIYWSNLHVDLTWHLVITILEAIGFRVMTGWKGKRVIPVTGHRGP
jgi:hypothetical protein